MSNRITRALSATSINGTSVVNPQGKDLGHIEDMMIDLQSGRILYAVLSFGGLLGIGNKLFAVPFEAFDVDQHDEKFVIDMNKERLENAPGFDKNNWPATPNDDFYNEVYSFYDVEPYWRGEPVR